MLRKGRMQKMVDVVEDVVCNACGQSCRSEILPREEGTEEDTRGFNFVTLDFSATGNFGSSFDGLTICDGVHLCDKCCLKLLADLQVEVRAQQIGHSSPVFALTPEGNWKPLVTVA